MDFTPQKPRPCQDASAYFDPNDAAYMDVQKLIEKLQSISLNVTMEGRKDFENFKPKQRVFLRKSETTLDQDDSLFPLWENAFNDGSPSRCQP